ncbi:permease of the major facilitator superfamily [Pediococcus damnosus]|uniref:Permease of the major facilitator superfamily n=1 Tax=Pediococcus damnosus TaxID=51663 RepID=A0A0R2HLE7_9LACO|nr:MFS transporter [Pediococcus damnosus]AMV60525.1 permease of the major facilitator superfamily [Pediococcus damnosus]AMV63008.1 permease of the major facilitator superfamily [Pediococcus damnosus]AMV64840.1 permease of the major facilitator superfamily [Pediococcus damnosus]AMV67105.1 permease of the major facilitator superfamily [Pediococcus damnosus]AMV69293.1 permease of the major facilitator superfamily [Pediococcus damnosus]
MKQNSQWTLLLATSMVSFMSTIDASIVNIAVPQLSRDLHAPMNEAEWVVSVYLVLICVLLIFFGKLSDQIGRISIFQIGTLVFVAGSLGCGLSVNLPMMLGMRVIQAVGASMTMATNFGIITQIFPSNRHGVALGVNSSFVQVGNIMGPGLGGLILATLSWHFIFFINVPIGLIAFAFGHKIFPKEERPKQKISMDYSGYLAYVLAIISFFVAIYWGQEIGFVKTQIIGLFVIAAVCVAAFILRENHTDKPLLDLHIFKNAGFSIGVISAMLVFAVSYFNNMIMPYYLQETLKYSSAIAGLILMSIPLLNIFSAPVGGMIGDHIGAEKVSLIALVLFLIPEAIFMTIQPSWGIVWLIIGLMLYGLANGAFQNNPMIMGNAGKQYQGIAGSIAALARNLGMSIGLSLSTSLLYFGISQKAGRRITTYPTQHPSWFVYGMHFSYRFAFAMICIALVLLISLVWHKSRKESL